MAKNKQVEHPDAPVPEPVVTEDGIRVVIDIFPTDGRRFWTEAIEWRTGPDDKPVPSFKVMEASKFFFGKGPEWLRWRAGEGRDEQHPQGWFLLDGEKLEPQRTPAGARYYTLFDIEKMAYALTEQGGIDAENLSWIVSIVKAEALLHGYQI